MEILITGGAGYIGSHVSHLLIDKGYKITIIDSLITGNKNLIPKKANFIKCDISNIKKIRNILKRKNFQIVLHFAGLIRVDESVKFPKKYIFNNYYKSKLFIQNCIQNGVKNIIFSSTAAVYGNPKKKSVNESDKLKPLNAYAKSKLMIEKYILSENKKDNLNYIILRYFNVAGADEKMRTGLISKKSTHLIKILSEVASKKKKKLLINGNNYKTIDGTPVRDFIFAEDAAEAVVKLLNSTYEGVINVGTGNISIYNYTNDSLLRSFNVATNTTDLSVSGNELYLSLRDSDGSVLIQNDTQYYILISAGAVLGSNPPKRRHLD